MGLDESPGMVGTLHACKCYIRSLDILLALCDNSIYIYSNSNKESVTDHCVLCNVSKGKNTG